MSAELAIVIKASAIVGAAQTAIGALGGSVERLGKTTAILESRQSALKTKLEGSFTRPQSEVAKLEREYKRLGGTLDALNKKKLQLGNLNAQKDLLQSKRDSLKSEWMGAAAAAGAVIAPVKMAIDFESSMADVKKVVDFDTPQQFKEMGRDILALTRSIPMAGTEIAAIVAAGGQSGVAKENLIGFATDAAKMGVAFDMAAGQAGESMATLSNVLQIPIPKISALGDAVNHLSDNANSKASDIVNVLTRVGSDTKQLGLTENQAAALGSTFLSMGKAPELAAQAIKGMTTSFSLAKVGKFDDQLKQLGLNTKTFAEAMDKDAQGAISDFMARVKQLPKNDQYPLLLEIFGKNYADDVQLLAGNVGEYNRQLDLLGEKDASGNLKYLGSMQREFENRSATTANQIQLFKSGIAELGITVGSVVLPAVNSLIADIRPLVNRLTDWMQANPKLAKSLVAIVLGLSGLKAGAFAARFAVNAMQATFVGAKIKAAALSSALLQGKAAFQASRAAMLLGNGTLLRQRNLVGAVARRSAHLSRGYRRINQSMIELATGGSKRTLAWLKQLPAQAAATAHITAGSLKKIKMPTLASGGMKMAAPKFSLKGMFMGAAGLAKNFGSGLLSLVLSPLRLIGAAIRFIGIGLRLLAFNPFGLLLLGLVAVAVLIYKYWKPIKAFFAGFWAGLKQGLAPLQPLFDSIGSTLSGLWQTIQPFVQPVIDWFKDFFSMTQVAEGGARSFGESIGLWIGEKIAAVAGWVGDKIGEIKAAFSGGLSGILALIINWSPLGAFYSAFSAVLSWFGVSLPATFTGFGRMIIQGLVNGIVAAGSAVRTTLINIIQGGISGVKTLLGIKSPSRVFMGIGGFVTQGLDIGLSRGQNRPLATVRSLASNLQQRFTNGAGELRSNLSARMQANSAEFAQARAQQATAAGGGYTIHYSPTINAPGGDPQQIQAALQMGQREFEQMFERLMADKARRAY